jgi:amino acid transporter
LINNSTLLIKLLAAGDCRLVATHPGATILNRALPKTLSLPMLVALGAAGVLGTSWVYTASEFFARYGAGGEIFGLALAGVLAVSVALSYAELASRFPRAGGELVFAYAAFGRHSAFVAGWLLLGAYISSLAFYVTAAGMLLSIPVPALNSIPLYQVADTVIHLPVLVVGVALALSVLAFTAHGMRVAGVVQLSLFTAMLTLAAVLIAVGFGTGRFEHFWPAFAPDADAASNILRFVLPAMTFLTGFSLVTTMAEDADLPPRRIGQAVLATVLVATAFYCTVLLATAWLIPWQTTATLEDGVIDAFRTAGFPWLGWSAYTISVLGLLTSFLALFSAASRVILALARGGLMPSVFARLSPEGRPLNALLFTLALTLGLGWLGKGALLWFLDTGGVYIGLAWLIAVLAMYRIRRRNPDEAPPFRARPTWLPGLGGAAAVAIIVATLLPGTALSLAWPAEYLILAAWGLLGVVVYRLAPRARNQQDEAAALLGGSDQGVGSRRRSADTAR